MMQYPICSKCGNTGLSIVDIEIDGQRLKGVQCNNCLEIIWVFQDLSCEINELKDKIEDLESTISDLEYANNTTR